MSSSSGELGKLPILSSNKKTSNVRKVFSLSFTNSQRSTQKFHLDSIDTVFLLILTALGMITRLFRIQYPNSTVFDEEHFGNFTNYYLKGQYFQDIHPPLAKLIMACVAHYAGYKGDYVFSSKKTFPTVDYVALRLTPAFFGALCVPLAYLTMRAMTASHFSSAVASICVMCDCMMILESRLILTDGILHFFSILAIFSIFLYDRFENWQSLIFEAICLGLVISVKYTSGGIILLSLYKHRKSFLHIVIICSIIALIHFITFAIHLTVLPFFPDDQHKTKIPSQIKAGLVDKFNPDWENRIEAPSMVLRVITLFLKMQLLNLHVPTGHPYSSKWYQWPLCTGRWLLFWAQDGRHLICNGNVLLWYPVFFSICFSLLLIRHCNPDVRELFLGYAFSLLPFCLVGRELFIYHYAIPLIFGIFNMARLVETQLKPMARGFVYMLIGALALLGYFIWNPWAYGLSTPDFQFMVWNHNWRGF